MEMEDSDADDIRDRTLVLRVLVPSLEARLREKMKDAEESASQRITGSSTTTSTSTSTNATTAAMSPLEQQQQQPKSILQDLEGVTCEPAKDGSTLFHFHCDGATYPARLVNLPCPVEVHKTHDHIMYYKCVDVAQMLIVYEDEMALEEAEAGPKSDGFPSYYHSGLTPPMKRVVQRRFEAREHLAVAPSRSEVAEVEMELSQLMNRIARVASGGRSKKPKPLTPNMTGAVLEEVVEDVVDYEPWMDDDGKQPFGIEFDDKDGKCTTRPELWLSPDTIEEIRKAEVEAREKEAAAAAASADAKKKKAAAKKDAAAKKKSKKKAEKEENQGPSVKKGIASKKNVEEVDEVTQAASQMTQGLDTDDILGIAIDDDFFDFGKDDPFSDLQL